jgi:hypothetical protein
MGVLKVAWPYGEAVDSIVLRVVLASTLILAASLVSRRWGPAVGGSLVALPLTSGPIALFLALDHGPGFAAAAATGSLVGAVAEIAFCLAYTALAGRGWPHALAGACVGFAAVATIVQAAMLPLAALSVGAMMMLVGALVIVHDRPRPVSAGASPAWDLPARVAVTAMLVVLITGAGATLGARLSGILAMFPVYVSILTVFAHRRGAVPAMQVLRGVLLGLFSALGFFIALGSLIERLGIARGFALATAVALALQAGSLAFVVARTAGTPERERRLPS